jgi:hypothetical protein
VGLKYSYICYTTNLYSIPLSITKKDNEMPNDTISYLQDKTEHDLLVILEGFKMLLSDAELFDMLAEKLDYPDEMLIELRDDVSKFMDDVV